MLEIQFYRTAAGACPVEEFLDSLGAKQAQKVLWVLRAVRALPRVPQQYFKKLEGTDNSGYSGILVAGLVQKGRKLLE